VIASYELKEPLLTISDVSLRLDGRLVLDRINASVRNVVRPGLSQGQVVAVLGPSGVGKTRLFRILAGLTDPDRGKVLVGKEQRPVRRGAVGVVAQDYPLFEHHTVLENLLLAARCHGLRGDAAEESSRKILDRFGLDIYRDRYPVCLSGGQRQRAAIAQQLLSRRDLLLMDEPFSGLDPVLVRDVCKLIGEVSLMDEVFTIVLVTHDIDAALSVADTVWLMGRRTDTAGNRGGAAILHIFDLMERGLAWNPEARSSSTFIETKREVESRFATL
jgi:polar amino acid transport system ATP-binding protein/sulfate transport system ATP-binding protein